MAATTRATRQFSSSSFSIVGTRVRRRCFPGDTCSLGSDRHCNNGSCNGTANRGSAIVRTNCTYQLYVRTSCMYQLYVPVVRTSCTHQLYAPTVRTNCTHQLYVPTVRTNCTYQLYVPILCTNCTYQLYVPIRFILRNPYQKPRTGTIICQVRVT